MPCRLTFFPRSNNKKANRACNATEDVYKGDVSFEVVKVSAAPQLAGWYRLKTQFRGGGECLEGNQSGSPVKAGAAFMDKCQNVSGQLWKLEKA